MKKPKSQIADKYHLKETRDSIKQMRKDGKTKKYIAGHFGFGKKALQDIIDRWGLEDKLLIPRLTGIR